MTNLGRGEITLCSCEEQSDVLFGNPQTNAMHAVQKNSLSKIHIFSKTKYPRVSKKSHYLRKIIQIKLMQNTIKPEKK